jgi:acetyl-CoA carboxylase, biotin carboxylase subunit
MKRIFIANRGEIAVRTIRACRESGITAVIGYSEADRPSLAVRLADEAILLGPSPSSESYLNIPRIIECIKQMNCEAVHPGYGFLSERAAFAKACEDAGIIFIGPSSQIIDLMGDKTRARQAVTKAGMPVVPGTLEPIENPNEALRIANEFGFPVMIKAAAGGGGKGMRSVANPSELESAFRVAQSEAMAAFGDPSLYLEKKIEHPHHVEIQILADHHKNVIHLGERECSIQRRHQKVIEECPSPFITNETRQKMCDVAVRTAKEIGYTNAGTMEFLVDANQNFYFLEMNTRVQVEHPTTELVTGVDIVKEQIRIASGLPLQFRQEDIQFQGAAIECRIYAEDPTQNFLPSPGKIMMLRVPGGPGVRDDSGVYEGFEVSIYYDPLLSKLVTWGRTRPEAIERMTRALDEYQIIGIKTTIPFYQQVLQTPSFQKGNVTTSFIPEFLSNLKPVEPHPFEHIALAAAAIFEFEHLRQGSPAKQTGASTKKNAWREIGRREGLQ